MTPGRPPPGAEPAASPGAKRLREGEPFERAPGASAGGGSPQRGGTLAESLGVNSWTHGDAALEEALKLRTEQERTKQEFYKMESRRRVLDILSAAMQLGIPGHAIPLLFVGSEDTAASNAAGLASAQQANNAAAAAHHAALQAAALGSTPSAGSGGATPLSLHGPLPFARHGPPVPPAVAMQQMSQQQPLPHMSPMGHPGFVGHPGQLGSPTTPVRTGSMDGSVPPSAGAGTDSGQTITPVQQMLQPAFTQGQPDSNSRFDVLNFERSQNAQDRGRIGHRATVSAVPAFPADTVLPGSATATPNVLPRQVNLGPSPFYPAQLVPPPQMSGPMGGAALGGAGIGGAGMSTPGAPGPHASPPFGAQSGPPVSSIIPRQGGYAAVTPSRPPPVRGRGHGASASASDLQIHQWKPKQINRDNRWKVVTNPFSRSKDKGAAAADDAPGPPPSKIPAQRGSTVGTSASSSDPAASARSQPPLPSPPPPSQPSLLSSLRAPSGTSVIAAQNTKRRSMGHARSRSSVTTAADQLAPPGPADRQMSPSAPRHDDGVQVLANLASEQRKIEPEVSKTEPSDDSSAAGSASERAQRLPSLLSYLESQAKHLTGSGQSHGHNAPREHAGRDSPQPPGSSGTQNFSRK